MQKGKRTFSIQTIGEEGIHFTNETGTLDVSVFVLEEHLFRVLFRKHHTLTVQATWLVAPGMEDIPYEGRDRLDLTPFSLPGFSYERSENEGTVSIHTERLKAYIQLEGFKVTWFEKKDGVWTEVAADRNTQAYNFDGSLGRGIFHYMKRGQEDRYYGLGEKTGSLNRHGRRYRMMNLDPMGYDPIYTDPLYKHIPFYLTRTKEKSWYGLFYDNTATSTFDMGNELDNYHGFYRFYHAEEGDLDYYMIVGADAAEVVETFSWLTGKTTMLPKWSLGYSGSTMTYTDAENAQEQLYQFLDDCKTYDIPCDSFQLSSGYTSIGEKRYVFNWNRSKFPDPKQFIADFHEQGIRLCANIKPCLLQDHPLYEQLKEKGMFINDEDGQEEEVVQFLDDVGAYLDFTNPETIDWWKRNVTEQLLEFGIDSTWNDNNEYEIWKPDAKAHGFGKPIDIGKIRPIQPLLMMKASFEAQLEFDTKKRPYLISRSGCPGMQRYCQTWTGDNRTSWDSLKYNIKTGLGLSLSGIYHVGHDVGGFAGEKPDPELFIRWIQNGIFHPRFTIHSWNEDKSVNVPWMYPEIVKPISDLMRFRVTLIPYLYQLMYESYQAYKPIIRPTFYQFPKDERTFTENDDFMVGDHLLVASVVEKGVHQRDVYLPENGKGWYDFHSERTYEGGQTITLPAPFNQTPLLVEAGAIIPINDHEVTFETKNEEARGFLCYPHLTEGNEVFRLYEDDGETNDYKDGVYTFVTVKMDCTKEEIRVHIEKEGTFPLPYEKVRVYFPKGEQRTIYVNGSEVCTNARQKIEVSI
ncbi:glycoside hydrolase family 31 protein [Halalkalibacterium halodurans]|uniref:Glucosidase n=1 Tax=Halalkalibacterium halodurans (strain ATCC BAA-125 / DSM 18197 / FERM 7344 / JCM 9153 / C-125) TaxID=272558 RepID=Q9KEZ5_HALH5|nr:glycoside hydrolase family 31 protein [Halalkalibacterium halodurans]MED4080330.1 glycoside hydrolase family 31 protein [Halalkalibacterium halodurans]MED4084606.1 glycoside hydrolase family 31 protein [Halalkalibacterium halodurans]MED4104830.1 glycoside hydrolase family 31 protein [Halalkalibacterium halodurans]MED4109729.1 glycoside hydrolase family 31 protein [Halalkalibacterium halodurans]MED4147926.1 glycoside hydrolase family 31 protein [Halalkalibacterium halodurans]